ncbi:universal stress protein [Lentzea flava]|nr:universal stress protein [Lentzea flava]
MSDDELSPIVVGVDGSAAAAAALRWAVEQARALACPLDVISVWHLEYGLMTEAFPDPDGLSEAAAERAQRKIMDEAAVNVTGVQLREILVEGEARKLLVEMSHDARFLVVGNRGHGPLAELLLGSVSSYCVHHASCPVVVVKAGDARGAVSPA